MRPQTPPPPYPQAYPMQYNQMPFVPLAPYPIEPEAYPGQYYSGGYVQVPYMPGMEMMEGPNGVGGPVYTEGGPGGIPYHVYPAPPPPYGMYHPQGLPAPLPPPHMYPVPHGGQPGPQPPQIGENCYAPYPPAQPYFFSYHQGPVPPRHQLPPAPQPSAGPHTPPSHQ
ncbi:hypothetical protein QAD02_022462 [Eretmocerus hayati]|uniref:Uncharacterized protein n=1 Tax=Eretmocerus hayati TaxID=131215 RepID=A0ACC2PUN3_9HYME|nr:hypothetical protein QAD02_022462 [Eretmocerus hayati]